MPRHCGELLDQAFALNAVARMPQVRVPRPQLEAPTAFAAVAPGPGAKPKVPTAATATASTGAAGAAAPAGAGDPLAGVTAESMLENVSATVKKAMKESPELKQMVVGELEAKLSLLRQGASQGASSGEVQQYKEMLMKDIVESDKALQKSPQMLEELKQEAMMQANQLQQMKAAQDAAGAAHQPGLPMPTPAQAAVASPLLGLLAPRFLAAASVTETTPRSHTRSVLASFL